MAAGAPAAFQSENTRVRPPIIDVFHVRSSSTARHTKSNSRQTRRGSASPQSAHTSSLDNAFTGLYGKQLFMKLFQTSNTEIVKCCQSLFWCEFTQCVVDPTLR